MPNPGRREWYLKLINSRTKQWLNTTINYQVYNNNLPTRPSIFGLDGAENTNEVQVTNGIFISETNTDGTVHFYTARSISALDLSVQTIGGRSYFLKNVNSSMHSLEVDPEKSEYMLTIAFNDNASVTTVRSLGFQLKLGMILKDVLVDIKTAFLGATAVSNTVNLGVSGNISGFYAGLKMSAVGLKDGYAATALSISTTGLVKTMKWGTLLAHLDTGAAATINSTFFRKDYVVPADTVLVAKTIGARAGTVTTDTGNGYIHYIYELFPSGVTNVL